MKTSDAVRLFGSKIRLAHVLGITPSAVSRWGERVPALRVYQINKVLDDLSQSERALLRGELPQVESVGV